MVVLVSGPFLGRVGLAEVASALVIAALVDLKRVAADFRLRVVGGGISAAVAFIVFRGVADISIGVFVAVKDGPKRAKLVLESVPFFP